MSTRLTLSDITESVHEMGVGESKRIEHKGCGKGNAACTRTPVGHLLHCFKCGGKGLVVARVAELKERVGHGRVNVVRGEWQVLPLDLLLADDCSFLLEYSIPTYMAEGFRLLRAQDASGAWRLCFPTDVISVAAGGHISLEAGGMACKLKPGTPHATRKWLIVPAAPMPYDSTQLYIPRWYLPTKTAPFDMAVLVEDPISALKISYACPNVYVIAMLGLSIGPALLQHLGNVDLPVVVWTDGDPPGMLRGRQLTDQLKFIRGTKATYFHYEIGLDPKDLTSAEMEERIDSIRQVIDSVKEHVEAVSPAYS
jgi:hypothetical protein